MASVLAVGIARSAHCRSSVCLFTGHEESAVVGHSMQFPSSDDSLRGLTRCSSDRGLKQCSSDRGLKRCSSDRVFRVCSGDSVLAGRGECDMSLREHLSHLGIDGKTNWVRDKASDGIPWRQIPCYDRLGRMTTTSCLFKTRRSGKGITCLSGKFSAGVAAKEALAPHEDHSVPPAASPSMGYSSVGTESPMRKPSSNESPHRSGPLHRERRHFKSRDVSPFAKESSTPARQRKTQERVETLGAHASSLMGAAALPTCEGRLLCASDSDARKARNWEFRCQLEQIREQVASQTELFQEQVASQTESFHRLRSVKATSQLLSKVLAAGPVLNATKACLASDAPAAQDSATMKGAKSKEILTVSRQSTAEPAEGHPFCRGITGESSLSDLTDISTGSEQGGLERPRWR